MEPPGSSRTIHPRDSPGRRRGGKNAIVITRPGYVTIKRRPAVFAASGARGSRITWIDRPRRVAGTPTARSNSRSSNNANMLVRGSLLWRGTRTHTAAAVREETVRESGMGQCRKGGLRQGWGRRVAPSSAGYRVKFSTEYKGPSRAWPKAGFTALLVNLAVCAYIFKTHFDPPGWKGSHCRRQFSESFPLRRRRSADASSFSHGAGPRVRATDTRGPAVSLL